MADKYYVYRPILNGIGKSEGTDRGRSYNETLAYGAYTGGPVNLTSMTINQVLALQTKMLKHPKNKMRSSACGRYQIIRTTLRTIVTALRLTGEELFNEEMQDRMACYLLGVRGIDKWIGGRLSDDTMLTNMAHEWASWPLPNGKGAYGGQPAALTVAEALGYLKSARTRAKESERAVAPVEPQIVVTAPRKAKQNPLIGWVVGLATALATMAWYKFGGH